VFVTERVTVERVYMPEMSGTGLVYVAVPVTAAVFVYWPAMAMPVTVMTDTAPGILSTAFAPRVAVTTTVAVSPSVPASCWAWAGSAASRAQAEATAKQSGLSFRPKFTT